MVEEGSAITIEAKPTAKREAESKPVRDVPTARPQTSPIAVGSSLSPAALVRRPAELPGVRSWTFDTIRHRGSIRALAWSPDGKQLAMGGDDGMIRLVDVKTKKLVQLFIGHGGRINTIAWSRDGKYLASGAADGEVRIWQPSSGTPLHVFHTKCDDVRSLDWSPKNEVVSGGSGTTIEFWNATTGEKRGEINFEWEWEWFNSMSTVVWSPDGRYIAGFPPKWRFFRVWNTETLEERAAVDVYKWFENEKVSHAEILQIAWDVSKTELLVLGKTFDPGNLSVRAWRWDAKSNEQTTTSILYPRFDVSPYSGEYLAQSPNGQWIAVSGEKPVSRVGCHIFESDFKKPPSFINLASFGNTYSARAVAWAPNSRDLAINWPTGDVFVFDAHSNKELQRFSSHPPVSDQVFWSPDGGKIGFVGNDYFVSVVELPSLNITRRWKTSSASNIHGFAWSPDGKECAFNRESFHMAIWRVDQKEPVRISQRFALPIFNVAWTSDGQTLAITLQYGGTIFGSPSLDNDAPTKNSPIDDAFKVAFSPNDELFAAFMHRTGKIAVCPTAKPNETTEVWLRHSRRGLTRSLVWSGDNKHVAVGFSDEFVYLVDAAAKNVDIFRRGSMALRFSTDGKQLAGLARDGTLKRWETFSGKTLSSLQLDQGYFRDGDWSPDGKTLAVATLSNTLRFFDGESGAEGNTLIAIEGFAGPNLIIAPNGNYAKNPPGMARVDLRRRNRDRKKTPYAERVRKGVWLEKRSGKGFAG